jgi:hypothetical protein
MIRHQREQIMSALCGGPGSLFLVDQCPTRGIDEMVAAAARLQSFCARAAITVVLGYGTIRVFGDNLMLATTDFNRALPSPTS